MADKNKGADEKAHPPAPAPPGPRSYAQVVAASEHFDKNEGTSGGNKGELLGTPGSEGPRAGGVGARVQAGGVEENTGKGGENSLTIEEEDVEVRDVNHEDSKLSAEALEPTEIESEPSEVETEPGDVEFKPRGTEIRTNDAEIQPDEPMHDAGAAGGHGQSPDRKPQDKPVKKTRFAAETTDIDSEVAAKAQKSEDIGTGSWEDEEGVPAANGQSHGIGDALESRKLDDFGYCAGKHSNYSTRSRRRPPSTRETQGGEERTPEPCGLGSAASYNIGDLPGARSGRHRGRKLSRDQEKSPETMELGDITIGRGEFGYKVGTFPSSHPFCPAEKAMHATQQEALETPESRELSNITIESGEFGYNVGNLPSSHPDKHKTHGRGHEDGTRLPTRHTKDDDAGVTAESEELGTITMEEGQFGYNVGKGENGGEKENPSASEARRRSEQTAGADQTRETEELANITVGEGEFGNNAGKGKSDEENEKPNASEARRHGEQIASARETGETEELENIAMGEGEFGYSIGKGESGNGKENPMTSQARNRGEKEAGTGSMRDSGYYGHVDDQSPKTSSTTRTDNAANGALQDYLHTFLSQGAKPLSPPTSTHASEVLELTEHLPDQKSQTVTITELRTVLADFKSDLLASITAESRLQKVENDVDFIRKQLSGGGTATAHHVANGIKGAPPRSPRGDARERILTWGFIGMSIITTISLAALWSVTTNYITLREEVTFGDRIAEWLFRQGGKG